MNHIEDGPVLVFTLLIFDGIFLGLAPLVTPFDSIQLVVLILFAGASLGIGARLAWEWVREEVEKEKATQNEQ